MNRYGNLFANVASGSVEQLDDLFAAPGVRIERIVSPGQTAPSEAWYDEPRTAWVVLLSGAAEIVFEDDPSPRRLQPGDCVLILPHQRHRLTWTTPNGRRCGWPFTSTLERAPSDLVEGNGRAARAHAP